MKNNKFARLLALLLSCLFIIGALSGMVVSAEEITDTPVDEEGTNEDTTPVPTVSIKYKNVAYEGAVKLVYYVESADLADGQTVKLALSDAAIDTADLSTATVYAPAGKLTVGSGDDAVEYDAFATEEIAPAALRSTVYAVALVVDADGAVVAESAPLAYSVFEYCMDRYDAAPSADQKALYTALLNFGAAVQTVLGYTDETIDQVGGWADAYYGVKLNTVIDGETIATAKSYYTEEEIGTVQSIAIEKFYSDGNSIARVNSAVADKNFVAELSGASVNVTVRGKVGFSNCNLLYSGGGSFVTFEDGKLPANIKAGNFKKDDTTTTGTWECLRTETLEDGSTNTYLHIEKKGSNSSNNVILLNNYKEDATKYIFEMNMCISNTQAVADTLLFIKFTDSKGNLQNSAASAFFAHSMNANAAGTKMGPFTIGQWYEVTFELVKAPEGSYHSWESNLYIDGVLYENYKIGNEFNPATDCSGIRFEPRYKFDLAIEIDNLFVTAQ